MTHDRPLRVCVFGAGLDTSNHGVSALCLSAIGAILERAPDSEIAIFDNSDGVRRTQLRVNGREFPVTLAAGRYSKKLYRRDSWWNMRWSARFGGLGNPGTRLIREADVAMDVSGGDSFTDLYGDFVYRLITEPKRAAIQMGTPLLYLPQTFGPFADPEKRRDAEGLTRAAQDAWARDVHSYEELKRLAGDQFDPARHHCGVDLAFGLKPDFRPEEYDAPLAALLQDDARPAIGFNVSGNAYNYPEKAAERYGFKADYRRAVLTILREILKRSDVSIVLVCHVISVPGNPESDVDAATAVRAELEKEFPGRLHVSPIGLDASGLKGLISRTAWFCGTRMHSTIAGLSTRVPTSTIAYSGKALGVFESIGQGNQVADARQLETDVLIERVLRSFDERDPTRQQLAEAWPEFEKRVTGQADEIYATCRRYQEARGR